MTEPVFLLGEALGADPAALGAALAALDDDRPEAALVLLRDVRRGADAVERAAVIRLRRKKYSWLRIGHALGITRQAAQYRHPDVE